MFSHICLLISLIIYSYVKVKLFSFMSDLIWHNNKKSLIKILIFDIFFILNIIFTPFGIKYIVSFYLSIRLFMELFNVEYKKALFYNLLICLFVNFIETFLRMILLNVFLVDMVEYDNLIIDRIILYGLYSFVIYILSNSKEFKKCVLSFKKRYYDRDIFYYVMTFIILLYYCLLQLFSNVFENKVLLFTIFLIIMLIVLFIFMVIRLLDTNYNLEVRESKYDNVIKDYNRVNYKYRIMKHNLVNDLLALKVSDNKDELITNIIKEYNVHYNTTNYHLNGINGLIEMKKNILFSNSVEFYINNNLRDSDISKLNKISYLKLCEAFGIVLDNAIEAASCSSEKYVGIDIDKRGNSIVIGISNKFDNEIDIDKICTLNYSTKDRNSGLGLNYLNKLFGYGIDYKINIVNDLFKVTMVVQNK